MKELISKLRALHVWPQVVADYHAEALLPRQIKGLYEVGKTAHEIADVLDTFSSHGPISGLRACPHCGPRMVEPDAVEHPDDSGRWQVFCGGCGSSSGNCSSRDKAVALWNQRYELRAVG
jgi:hypothetical protein